MGAKAIQSIHESKSKNPNGETIELLAEMCSSWGYSKTQGQVESLLVKNLNDLGYDVKYTCEPMAGGNGEFFVYRIVEGVRVICYSNNKKKHENSGAQIDSAIKKTNVEAIVKNVIDAGTQKK